MELLFLGTGPAEAFLRSYAAERAPGLKVTLAYDDLRLPLA